MQITMTFDVGNAAERKKFEAANRAMDMADAIVNLDAIMKNKINAQGTPADVKTTLTAVRKELRGQLRKRMILDLLEDLP